MINALDKTDTAPRKGIKNIRNECGDRSILKIWIMGTAGETHPPAGVYIRVVIYLVENVTTTIPILDFVLGVQSL